jgi:hypothetical protein
VSARPSSRDYYGGSEAWRWNARDTVEIYARKIEPGPCSVNLSLQGLYLRYAKDEDLTSIGIDEATAARFLRVPDGTSTTANSDLLAGPSIYFSARGEKDGRTVEVELALGTSWVSSSTMGSGVSVDVHPNALAAAPLGVEIERLLPRFQAIADADVDGDGRSTAEELVAVSSGSSATDVKTLLDVVTAQAGTIFVLR